MTSSGALAFAGNGANRPLHQDRQILRADDLALEQATQDAMLARARRYLHGWGVVAGFVPDTNDGTLLSVGPGYGVTPLGDELFLPERVSLPTAAAVAVKSCGPGPVGCEIVDPEALAAARRAASEVTVTAFLIARPASRDASPRAGVPEGCAHPAAVLLPSRRCGGVEFAIICTLPPSHVPEKLNCESLMPFVCGVRDAANPPLPWETLPGPEANFLVIAELTVTNDFIIATPGQRRTLWPVSLIQDWIAACLCPSLLRDAPPTGGVFTPRDGTRIPVTEAPAGIVAPTPTATAPSRFAPLSLATGAATPTPMSEAAITDLRDRLRGNVTDISGIGDIRARMLANIGVTTEGDFLVAPVEQLTAVLHLPEPVVREMKQELNARHGLGLAL